VRQLQLRRLLQTAIRQARQRKVAADERLAERQAAEAAARDLDRLTQSTLTQQQRIQQIVDRFNTLLDEGRFDIAQDHVAHEISRLAPGSSIDSSLMFGSQLTKAARENESLSRRQHDQLVRTLAGVESAAVPFADNPPIIYLPLEDWQQITSQREKYKSVDLHKAGSAEQLAGLSKVSERRHQYEASQHR